MQGANFQNKNRCKQQEFGLVAEGGIGAQFHHALKELEDIPQTQRILLQKQA